MNNAVIRAARYFYGRILPKGLALPVVRGPLAGTRIIHGSLAGEGGGASVYYGLIEPEQTSAICKLLKSGGVFYDIGANVGYYTVLGSRLVADTGRVISVEPSLRNVCLLNRHLILNRLINVQIISAACADQVGMRTFVTGNNYAVGHLEFEQTAERSYMPNTSIVPTVSIDAICQITETYPNVVKIDVEGAELEVLRGAIQTLSSARPVILLSTHSELLKARCKEMLTGYAYSFGPLANVESNTGEWLCRPLS